MKPNFIDRETYLTWRNTWKEAYDTLSSDIRAYKKMVKITQQRGEPSAKLQRELFLKRRDATKMMSLLEDAKVRRDRIVAMHKQITEQGFPLSIDTRNVEFAFNRIHNEFEFMPRWLIKAKGQTFYVKHVDVNVPFTTRELSNANTKGTLRFKNATVMIDVDGNAQILPKTS